MTVLNYVSIEACSATLEVLVASPNGSRIRYGKGNSLGLAGTRNLCACSDDSPFKVLRRSISRPVGLPPSFTCTRAMAALTALAINRGKERVAL